MICLIIFYLFQLLICRFLCRKSIKLARLYVKFPIINFVPIVGIINEFARYWAYYDEYHIYDYSTKKTPNKLIKWVFSYDLKEKYDNVN
jgi:hypothetical protein